jgi:hypothetical protein
MRNAVIIALIIIVLAGIVIFSNGAYDLGTREGLVSFAKAYGTWTKSLAGNVVDITGYAISKDWLPR